MHYTKSMAEGCAGWPGSRASQKCMCHLHIVLLLRSVLMHFPAIRHDPRLYKRILNRQTAALL
jgi:hypothetical protein